MEVLNLFQLHGKWFENDENRVTSSLLFFLNEFKVPLLQLFLDEVFPNLSFRRNDVLNAKFDFQPYITGKIPDAEIIFKKMELRILIEAKIGNNAIDENQLIEYAKRLHTKRGIYPHSKLLAITQINELKKVQTIAKKIHTMGYLNSNDIHYVQWKKILDIFKSRIDYNKLNCIENSIMKGKSVSYLGRLTQLFIKEVERTMYNKIVISELSLKDLDEVVLTIQDDNFLDMAINDFVFWPYANFSPSEFVTYYGLARNSTFKPKHISHIARVKYLFHNVTIDEIPTIPEFRALQSFKSFLTKAYKIYNPGNPQLFAIAITEEPIAFSNPIPYVYKKGAKIQPNIIPGRKTTLSKILKATTLEDLY